jgi:hypothetical protein
MLHHHTHNCTISYFIFFSKQEMCWKAILRQFFFWMVIFQSFFQGLAAFSIDSEPKKNPEEFFKKYAFDSKNIQIKNLIAFPKHFPDHPLQIYVYYYMGCNEMMQSSSDKNSEKYLLNALKAFDNVEIAWIRLNSKNDIPMEHSQEYAEVKDAALIQSANIYLTLAKQSHGIKKDTLLLKARSYLEKHQNKNFFPKSQFIHVAILLEENKSNDALATLNLMEKELQPSNHYLNKARLIAAHHLSSLYQPQQALLFLNAIPENSLSPTEALDLWILQSLCLRDQQNYHAAHLALSKAINSSVASSQRLRAMCLRAALYEIEGRDDLAIKQWDAVKNKSGKWGQLAKLKLKRP